MRIIVPAAGSGHRFRSQGYATPKPLIPVLGKPMIQHVLDVLYMYDSALLPLVLCRTEDYAAMAHVLCKLKNTYGVQLRSIPYAQAGAALTVLCANGQVHDAEPVLVVDADNIYTASHVANFMQWLAQKRMVSTAGILTTKAPQGAAQYSYVHALERSGRVIEVAEKVHIGNRITCGMNYWPSWAALRGAICNMVKNDDRVNGEFYLAPAFNYGAQPAYCFDIPPTAFRTVGTPEDLKNYEDEVKPCNQPTQNL